MPGSRIAPDGKFQYSGCMMDDQLVEIDTRTFKVSRRFSVAKGKEGPLPVDDRGEMARTWPRRPRPASPRSIPPTWATPA
jgi:hypothetical protein